MLETGPVPAYRLQSYSLALSLLGTRTLKIYINIYTTITNPVHNNRESRTARHT